MSSDPIKDYDELRDLLARMRRDIQTDLSAVEKGVRELDRARLEAESEAADHERDAESAAENQGLAEESVKDVADAYADAVQELAALAVQVDPVTTENVLLTLHHALGRAVTTLDAPPAMPLRAVELRFHVAVNPPDPTTLLQAAMRARYSRVAS